MFSKTVITPAVNVWTTLKNASVVEETGILRKAYVFALKGNLMFKRNFVKVSNNNKNIEFTKNFLI